MIFQLFNGHGKSAIENSGAIVGLKTTSKVPLIADRIIFDTNKESKVGLIVSSIESNEVIEIKSGFNEVEIILQPNIEYAIYYNQFDLGSNEALGMGAIWHKSPCQCDPIWYNWYSTYKNILKVDGFIESEPVNNNFGLNIRFHDSY